jgi:hypothetical protein
VKEEAVAATAIVDGIDDGFIAPPVPAVSTTSRNGNHRRKRKQGVISSNSLLPPSRRFNYSCLGLKYKQALEIAPKTAGKRKKKKKKQRIDGSPLFFSNPLPGASYPSSWFLSVCRSN